MLKRKSKRVLSIVLAVAMIVGLFPIAAFAEETSTWTQVSSAEELSAALANGGNIQLSTDITVDTPQNWTITKAVVLDLNGNKLTNNVTQQNYFIMKVSGGSLTITDNSDNHGGIIESTSSSYGYGIQLLSNSKFTLLGGTIKTTQETVDIYTSATDCSITISGGQLISSADNVLGVRGEGTTVDITGGTLRSDGRTGIYVSNYGEPDSIVINMTGGKLIHNDGRSGAMQIYKGATVNIGGSAEIQAQYQGLKAQENVILNVTGGTISAGSDAIAAEGSSTVNVSGGTLSTTSNSNSTYAVSADDTATVNISGGVITSAKTTNNVGGESENITIVGGKFQQDVSQYVPAGNKVDEDGNVVIDDENSIATVGKVGYASLQAAIDAAEQNNGTVNVTKSHEITTALVIERPIIIEGNGNTITAKDCAALTIGADLDSLSIRNLNLVGATANENYIAGELMAAPYMGLGTYNLGYGVKDLNLDNVTIANFDYGIYFSSKTDNDTDLVIDANNVTVQDCYIKGVYLEKLTDSTFTNCKFINNGDDPNVVGDGTKIPGGGNFTQWMSGVDINLKYGDYKNIKFDNCTFSGNGANRGTALHIKARDDGSYTTDKATLDGITVEDCTFTVNNSTDSATGKAFGPIVLGEPDKNNATPVNITIQDGVNYTNNLSDEAVCTVSFNSNGGNAIPTQIIAKDAQITLPSISRGNGYTFLGWSDGTTTYKAGVTVTISADTTFTAQWQPPYNGKYSYEIFTKVGENGTISVDRYATEGDDVTITVSPDEAYLLDELNVTANGKEVEVKDNGDGTYTFKMPSADAKIVVTFAEDPDWEPAPEMPFVDVNEGDWFYDVVLYAYDNGLMTGVSATEFAPNQTTTRGMIVSMLARLEGVTSAEDAGFADVAANDWYATAVNWAASVGVVNGYEDNTFRPNAPITREQMAAILYNYADYKGYDVSARADLSDYADAASISSWAEDVLAWANAEGLINGMTATTIDPQGATTRAQTAAMFERFLTAHEA